VHFFAALRKREVSDSMIEDQDFLGAGCLLQQMLDF
jgi:hypothetical protein